MGGGEQAGRPHMSDWDVLAVSAGLARCSTLKVGVVVGERGHWGVGGL